MANSYVCRSYRAKPGRGSFWPPILNKVKLIELMNFVFVDIWPIPSPQTQNVNWTNVHKTFRIRPGRLLNAFCTFNLHPVSTGTPGKISKFGCYGGWFFLLYNKMQWKAGKTKYLFASTVSKFCHVNFMLRIIIYKFPSQ